MATVREIVRIERLADETATSMHKAHEQDPRAAVDRVLKFHNIRTARTPGSTRALVLAELGRRGALKRAKNRALGKAPVDHVSLFPTSLF